jgi:hypothetical protein
MKQEKKPTAGQVMIQARGQELRRITGMASTARSGLKPDRAIEIVIAEFESEWPRQPGRD